MNPEMKAKWVAALKSGSYKQGRERLRSKDTYCCLGVFCDISGKGKWEGNEFGQYIYRLNSPDKRGYRELIHYLTSSFCNEYGIDEDKTRDLAMMNDRGSSFEDIAEKIEREF